MSEALYRTIGQLKLAAVAARAEITFRKIATVDNR
jgi:hypothetical protein